jgi:RHS repeat-associated protein
LSRRLRLLSVLHNGGYLPGSTSYTYDAAGNRTSKTAVQQASPNPVSVTSNYTYDNIYELTQAVVGGTLAEGYTYDAVGNRLTSVSPASYNYNASNELTSSSVAAYTYDNNGNTLSKTTTAGATSYTWDFENRLSSVTLPGRGGTVNFKYDPFGRRIEKASPAGTTVYGYDGDNVVQELDGSGLVIARYTQGTGVDEPLAMTQGLTTSYFHADGLGSITSLTNSAGNLAASYVYDSFGNLTASTGTITNPFQYTGREFDSETGLYYYRARYYDPMSGRFLSEDPLRFVDVGSNLYAYVGNSPTNLVDPSGTDKTYWDNWGSPNGRTPLDGPRNGNWGGKNWSGGWNPKQHGGKDGPGAPTDSEDECYMDHDHCYERNCPSNDKKGRKDCDRKLVQCLKQLPKDPRQWPHRPRAGTEGDSASFRDWAIWYFGD